MRYTQLTLPERIQLAAFKKMGASIDWIATQLGRHRSSIYRELRRNKGTQWGYFADRAQYRCNSRKRNSARNFRIDEETWNLVRHFIVDMHWSPDQISNTFKKSGVAHISKAWIYEYIWKDKALGGNLYRYLRQGDRICRKRYGKRDGRSLPMGRRGLGERPAGAKNRSRIGHFEMDLVHGSVNKDCLLTLVDRKSGFTIIRKLQNKSKNEIVKYLVPIVRKYRIKTITVDNGPEWYGFPKVESLTRVRFYFATPYHAWERGTNENTNGLIREFIPKKYSMRNISQYDCNRIAKALNTRPRKRLNYLAPDTVHFSRSCRTSN